ncbi:MAG TPA: C39 family peptidase [Rhodanobacteraceae bacterium]|nr:C39 family peptidase [Rhodanobacteraceae bacterium]
MKRRASCIAWLLALVPLCAAAGNAQLTGVAGANYRVHVTTLKEQRFRNTIHQKYDFSCGSAAVATLLTYQYGFPMSEQTAFAAMFAHGDRARISKQGFSLLDIKRFLAALGFEADGFIVPLEKLEQARLPAIVLIDEHGYHHFVVIKGMLAGRVLIGDPAKGTRSIPEAEFEKSWKNHLVFVIHNHRNRATFNSRDDWRAAPMAMLAAGIDRRGLYDIVMPKSGTDGF